MGKMFELGMITEEEYEDALNTDLEFRQRSTDRTSTVWGILTQVSFTLLFLDLSFFFSLEKSKFLVLPLKITK